VEHRPKAFSKAELHARLWPDTFVSDGSLAVLVAGIRAALEDDAREPRFVRTLQRFGYSFCGDTIAVPAAAPPAGGRPICCLIWGGERAELADGETVLGRDSEARVRFEVPGVSRRHARIFVRGAEAMVEDLGSKNGTYVRGDRIEQPASLADGDELRLGPVAVTFRMIPADSSTATVTALGMADPPAPSEERQDSKDPH
jgi:hypothetical protein